MPDDHSDRLARLEKKVDWMIRLIAIQLFVTVLLGLSYGISYLFQIAGSIVLLLVFSVPLLYLFRHSLPGAARRAGKQVGKLIASLIWRKSTSP